MSTLSLLADFPSLALCLLLFIFATLLFFAPRRKPAFLVQYACFQPPPAWRVSFAAFMELSSLNGHVDDTSLSFQRKVLQHSGMGEHTSLPPPFHFLPSRSAMHLSRSEAQTVFFSMLDELFLTTGVKPTDIDVLVLNCCLFYPSPSVSAMVVNRYKMRSDIKSYNLSGVGCAASLLAIDMVRRILQVKPNSYALVLSAENMSGGDYKGNRRSMLIPNCLFRSGGAAILLSNRASDKKRSKYQLLQSVGTINAAEDEAYQCIFYGEDIEDARVGVSLSKDLMNVAGKTVSRNVTTLALNVLPVTELMRYVYNLFARKVLRQAQLKPYVPDFKLAFEHFCIHAGGRAVIRELEKNLRLSEEQTEASRMTLHRFGNASSTTVWYEWAYLEAMLRICKGAREWKLGVGSGFKCFSVVWQALNLHANDCPVQNPWSDSLVQYPVTIPDVFEL